MKSIAIIVESQSHAPLAETINSIGYESIAQDIDHNYVAASILDRFEKISTYNSKEILSFVSDERKK